MFSGIIALQVRFPWLKFNDFPPLRFAVGSIEKNQHKNINYNPKRYLSVFPVFKPFIILPRHGAARNHKTANPQKR